ncbi:hypothetical protein M8J76_008372 [Diaphorina citri]|nr:hypothetical protein M8J76_008372 [Diaphorina citri]
MEFLKVEHLPYLILFLAYSCHGDIYSKHTTGRRVCSKMADQAPVKVTVPTYQQFTQKCFHNQICKGVRLTYETKYECCPGWSQNSKLSHAVCSTPCQNGGKCVAPDSCSCNTGFTGSYCESDVNECDLSSPCSHDCINTHGSYVCRCPSGHKLDEDRRTCVKVDRDSQVRIIVGTFTYVSDWTKFATEVHDLEVEFINPNRKNFKKKHRSKTDCSGVTNVPIDHQLIKQFESKIEEMRKVHKEEFSELKSKVSALFSKVELLQQRLQNCAACKF